MLLYGPPGTGKTLIARSIGKMLTEREPKVVNGPEILNKFVGQSEENIRELFADAKADQEKNGDDAGLHIIIFDEIDAICKQRGSTNTGSGVHDTVVNQLLSMIDGVDSLNDVLVIGMTNRKDLLDSALLRSETTAAACLHFMETAYVGCFAVYVGKFHASPTAQKCKGLDYWKDILGPNSEETRYRRELILLVTSEFCFMVLFFCAATLDGGSETDAIAAGFFFAFVAK